MKKKGKVDLATLKVLIKECVQETLVELLGNSINDYSKLNERKNNQIYNMLNEQNIQRNIPQQNVNFGNDLINKFANESLQNGTFKNYMNENKKQQSMGVSQYDDKSPQDYIKQVAASQENLNNNLGVINDSNESIWSKLAFNEK